MIVLIDLRLKDGHPTVTIEARDEEALSAQEVFPVIVRRIEAVAHKLGAVGFPQECGEAQGVLRMVFGFEPTIVIGRRDGEFVFGIHWAFLASGKLEE